MQRQLLRSQSDRIVAGVCGGIGDYFEVDSTIIRLLFVLFAFAGGSAIIVYFILWLIIPEEDGTEPESFAKDVERHVQAGAENLKGSLKQRFSGKWTRAQIVGVILIVFGGIVLLQQYIPQLAFHNIWPVLIIILGVWMLLSSFSSRKDSGDETADEKDRDDAPKKEDE